ncbi:substrate-binding periplasmic protein [Marinimicrobium locisalis]|uniref:substrate-binding periplasmic protein n=1 Tax=Marinimicrobium locisalis TaxID=546022 RepID=UPI0032214BED
MLGSRCFIVVVLFWKLCTPALAEEVSLGTNVSDFDQFYNRGGGSIKHVQCIFSKLGYSPSVQRMPWLRARQEVSTGRVDGFFTAIASGKVEEYAELSAPLVLESWYWYWPAGTDEPESGGKEVRIGAVLGSHQALWLDQHGYSVHLRVNSLPQLVKLMVSDRIDTFVADREHMGAILSELGIGSERYEHRFMRYMPLGVYFGNGFLEEHPGFLARFNAQIFPCAPASFVVSAEEQAETHRWLTPVLDEWIEGRDLAKTVIAYSEQREGWSAKKRELLDEEWREAFRQGNGESVGRLVDGPLSDELRVLEADQGGILTEIIVTDRRGFNIAVSKITSDFWQGDEAKFTQAWELEPGQLQFSPVRNDESTQRFQISVSRPVYHPESGAPVGVIIVGVDVEKALSRWFNGG